MNKCTQTNSLKALRKIGIENGDILMVHSSYKSLGGVEGGAKAVIEAFTEVLGDGGTLLMPAFTFDSVTFENPVFDYEKSKNCVGYLGEDLRTEVTGAVRSIHATHSVCAIGKKAKELCGNHEKDITPVGENSPITKLAKQNGKILMLGCSPDHLTICMVLRKRLNPTTFLTVKPPLNTLLF